MQFGMIESGRMGAKTKTPPRSSFAVDQTSSNIMTKTKKTMKAAVVHAFGQPLTIEEVEIPEVGPDQILMKVEACGVCHRQR